MVWLIDAYDRAGQSAVPDFLPRLPAGTRVIRAADDTLPDDWTTPRALVITGSAASAADPTPWVRTLARGLTAALAADVPVLGVCFGHQLLASVAFGPKSVRRSEVPEVGWVAISRAGGPDPVFDALPDTYGCFVSHEDEVLQRPGMDVRATSEACPVHGFRVAGRRAWGLQYHLETDPVEVARIVRGRAARHPELGVDPARILADLQDTSALADGLFAAFLHAAGIPFGPALDAVEPSALTALREHLARIKHDLGKYVYFQQRWLGPEATDAEQRAALEADVLHTRRGPEGSVDAPTVWADFRPALVGEIPLGGHLLDLSNDPDVARLDGAMRSLGPVLTALRQGLADSDLVRRGGQLSGLASEASRRLVERARPPAERARPPTR